MFRNLGIGAAAVLAAGLVAAGCSDSGDTIIQGGRGVTSTFPGSSVFDNALAPDGQPALNVNSVDGGYEGTYYGIYEFLADHTDNEPRAGVKVFWCSGKAVVLFGTDSNSSSANGSNYALWAAYYNGSKFTVLAQLNADDLDTDNDGVESVEGFAVGWITSGRRAGDAFVLWKGYDLDAANNDSDEPNYNAYASYFDASANAFLPGYQLNEDTNTVTGSASAEDVRTVGLLSDAIHGAASWEQEANEATWGDTQSFLVVLYAQEEETTNAAAAQAEDMVLHYRICDLDAATDADNDGVEHEAADMAAFFGSEQDFSEPSGIAESTGTNTSDATETLVDPDTIYCYNNELLVRLYDSGSNDAEPEDTSIMAWAALDTSGTSPSFGSTLNMGGSASTNDLAENTTLEGVFGTDEGLVNNVYFGLSNAGTGTTDDTDVVVWQTSGASTTAFDATNMAELDDDAGTGTASDAGDPAADLAVAISRDGQRILVAWTQDDNIVSAGTDTATQIWGAAFQTTRTAGTTAPDLNDADPPFTAAQELTALASGEGISSFEFQNELGYRCGIQSDVEAMGIVYNYDPTGTAVDDRVNVTVETVTVNTTGNQPTLSDASDSNVVDSDTAASGAVSSINWYAGYDDNNGGVAVLLDLNNDDSGTDDRDYQTLEVWVSGEGRNELASQDEGFQSGFLGAVTLPKSESTTGSWAGSTFHIFFRAPKFGRNTNATAYSAIGHRAVDKNAAATTAFEDVFTPALTETWARVSGDAGKAVAHCGFVYSGSTLGYFYAQSADWEDNDPGTTGSNGDLWPAGNNVYYREWNGSWGKSTTVDDYGYAHIHGFQLSWDGMRCADTASQSMMFINGELTESYYSYYSAQRRVAVRIHD